MKKFLIAFTTLVLLLFSLDWLYYSGKIYLPASGEVQCISRHENGKLYIDRGTGMEPFTVRGVNLGLGKPGYFATDYAVTEEEYLRWFRQIQDLGANVIRTYTLAHPAFYRAFYRYNQDNPNPLYLIHGVWVDDYLINSSYSALDPEFYEPFLESCKNTVDVIHGQYKQHSEGHLFPWHYKWDISPWVYGYILGIEWEGDIVVYTNDCLPQVPQYEGDYLTTEDANNFEVFLAAVGDKTIAYETDKYASQRAVAFANWPTTCPLEFPEKVKQINKKYGQINVDNIHPTDKFIGAMFASYHIYPYYPEYVLFEDRDEFPENTYLDYLTRLNENRSVPVVISEFGVPASRGMASYEKNQKLGRNQGMMNEQDQGKALISLYEDVIASGSAGGIVFIWQDEWFKRTWNTMSTVDLDQIIYWSDIQTNEQHFGLMSFDPGKEKRNCRIDGLTDDWDPDQVVFRSGDYTLSMQYDVEGIYFLVEKPGLDLTRDRIYLPVDLTPDSGSTVAENLGITMDSPCDFIVDIHGREDSRVWVQARYDITSALSGPQLKHGYSPYVNPPATDSPEFRPIHLMLHELDYYHIEGTRHRQIPFREYNFNLPSEYYYLTQHYETGKLRYGNGDPQAENFDSLADFCAGPDAVEIRLPWQLLNFSDPVHMRIHKDYYTHYGVESQTIRSMRVGIGDGSTTIATADAELKPLGRKPVYHERLKESYYILQDYWSKNP